MQQGFNNKKLQKMKYAILQYYGNCRIYEISQIAVQF
jgi:hypothetical protein